MADTSGGRLTRIVAAARASVAGRPGADDAFARTGHIVGVVVIAAGLLVIGLGWYGASGTGGQVDHQTVVTAQLPYLLSGGALGVALVIIGVGLLIVHTLRVSRARLEYIVARNTTAATASEPTPADVARLVVTGTASYHDATCRLVPNKGQSNGGVDYLTPEEAAQRGLRPCRLCRPPEPALLN